MVWNRGEELQGYRLPASAFLFTVRGTARVWLDHSLHLAKRFHLFHGGKGMSLRIWAEDELEYYLILYKPILSLSYRQDIAYLMERDNPFHYQYAFVPRYPLALFDKIERLELEWNQQTMLGKLQVKGIFYQFVYEVLEQLHQQDIEPVKPDLVALATHHIHEHYHEPLTLDSIAQALECSEGHLSICSKAKCKRAPSTIWARYV